MDENKNNENKEGLYTKAIKENLEKTQNGMMVEESLPAFWRNEEDAQTTENQGFHVVEDEDKIGDKTLADYLALPDDVRVELIDGVFYDMSAPRYDHARIITELLSELRDYVKKNNGPCCPFTAPADVQLDKDDKTVVQPDIFVVCDVTKINGARLFGAPDMVVEIVSPSNWRTDVEKKKKKYERAGVREYWMIFPEKLKITVCYFEGKEAPVDYTFHDKIPVRIWGGKCVIDFEEIYQVAKYFIDQNTK